MKRNLHIIYILIIFVLVVSVFYVILHNKNNKNSTTVQVANNNSVVYTNNEYGFYFNLPESWFGYSIVLQNWSGFLIDDSNQKFSGPEILIRHPLWTEENPRQDIPIMIFTKDQWALVKQEKLSVGAAPIIPSELGSNNNYVFALPARYNFAFLTGFEEVQQIIDNKSLHSF